MLQQWEKKQIEKKSKKEQKTSIKKQEAIERDKNRRKVKEEARIKKQSRKGKNTIYRDYSADEIAQMNPAKRRRLEDLGIL